MGENGKHTILRQLAKDAVNGCEVQVQLFEAYLKTHTDDEKEALAILREVYKEVKEDKVMQSIGYYKSQNRSEELNAWLDFTERYVLSVKKEPDKLKTNTQYWVDRCRPMKNKIDDLIVANIIYQVNEELF